MTRILEAEHAAETRLRAAEDNAALRLREARERARKVLSRADSRVRTIRQSHPWRLERSMTVIETRRETARHQPPLGEAERHLVRAAARAMADELLGTGGGD